MEGEVFGEIFLSFEGKIGKMVKNSITPNDREYRETYFGPINLGQNYLKYFQIFLSPTPLENGEKMRVTKRSEL